jgi:hypothetical protein
MTVHISVRERAQEEAPVVALPQVATEDLCGNLHSGASVSSSTPRVVSVLIRGVPTLVACPSWCRQDHSGDSWNSLADVAHFSDPVQLGDVAEADLWWSPGGGPRLLVWVDGGTNAELDLEQAERMLAGLSEKVAALRAATAGVE